MIALSEAIPKIYKRNELFLKMFSYSVQNEFLYLTALSSYHFQDWSIWQISSYSQVTGHLTLKGITDGFCPLSMLWDVHCYMIRMASITSIYYHFTL
jgi:hypothetical protein